MSSLLHLFSVTNKLLEAKKDAYGEIFTAADELYELLLGITGINPGDDKHREHLSLKSGNAIGLTWAAMCIKDIMRTKRFMDGIYEAVTDVQKKNKDRPVHILYAGTGPFATLVLPLMARFNSDQLQFSLLEINETSFGCLQNLFTTLHLEKYIKRVEKADASTWLLPANEEVDIFISETIQQGLRSEPLVAICMNIVPQLKSSTIIIPKEIILKAALINSSKRARYKLEGGSEEMAIHTLGTIFTLNKDTILQYDANLKQTKGAYHFPAVPISIPAELIAAFPLLYILTDIIVYNNQKIGLDESPLTLPLNLTELTDPRTVTATFHYQADNNPGIRFSIEGPA